MNITYVILRTLDFYVGDKNNIDYDHIQGLIDMYTDGFCLYGNYKTIEQFLRYGVTVYHYVLTYEGQNSYMEIEYGIENMGVAHGDDLFYLFNYGWVNGTVEVNDPIDLQVRDTMLSAWTDFATYGDPTPPGKFDDSWTPLKDISYFQYWNISGPNPQMDQSDYIQERMQFWEKTIV